MHHKQTSATEDAGLLKPGGESHVSKNETHAPQDGREASAQEAGQADEAGALLNKPADPAVPSAQEAAPAASPRKRVTTAPAFLTADELRQQIDATSISKRTPGHTDAIMALVDARARAAGKSTDQWISDRVAGVRSETERKRSVTLNESTMSVNHGAVQFIKDGRAIISVFEHGNESTIVHELGHVFRRDLSPDEESVAGKWAGALPRSDGTWNWNRTAEERFARGWERYLHDGVPATHPMKAIFDRFTHWMREVYRSVVGSPINKELSPEIRGVFDRMLSTKNAAPEMGAEPMGEMPDTRMDGTGKPAGSRQTIDQFRNDRPDLATPGKTPAEREALVSTRNNMEMPESQAQAPIREKAKAYVEADPMGSLDTLRKVAEEGHGFSAEHQAMASALLSHLLKTKGMDSPEYQEAARMWVLDAGHKAGQAFAMRRDLLNTPEGRTEDARAWATMPHPKNAQISDVLRSAIKETERLYQMETNDGKKRQLSGRLASLRKKLAVVTQKEDEQRVADLAFYKSNGFDMSIAHPDWANDEHRWKQFLALVKVRQEGFGAQAREVYNGMLHMSGLVLGKKAIADTIGIGSHAAIKHLASIFRGDLPEAAAYWGAIGPGLRRSALAAWETARTGFLPAHLISEEDQLHAPAIPGAKGEAWRAASLITPVRMIDAFAKSFIAHTEVAVLAHRSAVDADGNRLTGDEYRKHIEDEIGDHTSESWGKARKEAMDRTFTKAAIGSRALNNMKYGYKSTALGKAGQATANVLQPFYGIPMNIATQRVRDWTPGLSDALALARAFDRDPKTMELTLPKRLPEELAQGVLRWGAFAAAGGLVSAGLITGKDDKVNPYSINLWGHHFGYQNLVGLAGVLGAAADYFNGKDKSTYDRAENMLEGSWKLFGEAPLLHLINDFYDAAIRQSRHQDGFLRLVAQHLAVQPSVVRQAVRSESDDIRAQAVDARAKWFDRLASYMQQNYEGNTGKPIHIDGKTLTKDRFDSGVSTIFWRMMSPLPLGDKVK